MGVKIHTRASNFKLLGEKLEKFANGVRGEVVRAGTAEAARVVYEEVKANTSGLNGHPEQVTGTLHESIYRVFSEDRSDDDRKVYHISWNRKKAPHGHLIEFGTSRSPAYPFVRPAFAKVKEAMKAGKLKMKQRFQEKKNGS